MPRTIRRSAPLAAALALAAGCSDSTAPVSPTPLPELLGQLNAPAAPAGVLTDPATLAGTIVPASCTWAAASQSFACAPQAFGGVTATRSYQLLDAAGAPQPAYGAAVVAIRLTTDVSGTVTPPAIPGAPQLSAGPATITRHEVMTIRGLAANSQRTLDGTASTSLRASFTSGSTTVPVTITGADTVSGLTLAATPGRNGQPRYPLGGKTIHVEQLAIGGSAPLNTSVRAVMTFNGTGTATMSLTTGLTTRVCTVNLAEPGRLPSCT